MAKHELISQPEIYVARDLALPIVFRPECEVTQGLGNFATVHQLEDALVGISSMDNNGQKNPGFRVVIKTALDPEDRIKKTQDYTFWRKGLVFPKYKITYSEDIIYPAHFPRRVQPPKYSAKKAEFKQWRSAQKEIDSLDGSLGSEVLDKEKFDFLIKALGYCSLENRILFGRAALHAQA